MIKVTHKSELVAVEKTVTFKFKYDNETCIIQVSIRVTTDGHAEVTAIGDQFGCIGEWDWQYELHEIISGCLPDFATDGEVDEIEDCMIAKLKKIGV